MSQVNSGDDGLPQESSKTCNILSDDHILTRPHEIVNPDYNLTQGLVSTDCVVPKLQWSATNWLNEQACASQDELRKSNRDRIRTQKGLENDILEKRKAFKRLTRVLSSKSELLVQHIQNNTPTESGFIEKISETLSETMKNIDILYVDLTKDLIEAGLDKHDEEAMYSQAKTIYLASSNNCILTLKEHHSSSRNSHHSHKSMSSRSKSHYTAVSSNQSSVKNSRPSSLSKSHHSSVSDNKSLHSSRRSNTSKASSYREKVLALATKQVEFDMLEETQSIEKERMQIEQRAKMLSVKKELKIAQAEVTAIKMEMDQSPSEVSIQKKLNPHCTEFISNISTELQVPENVHRESPSVTKNEETKEQTSRPSFFEAKDKLADVQYIGKSAESVRDLSKAILEFCKIQTQQSEQMIRVHEMQMLAADRSSLAKAEPPVFSGDVLQYNSWNTSFSALIDSRMIPDHEKLYYLGKYTGGKAKEMILSYIELGSDTSYVLARGLIHERFGNPVRVYDAFKVKLENWERMTKGAEIQEFCDFVQRMCDSMTSIGYIHMFDNISTIKTMLQKLPPYIHTDWQKYYEKLSDCSRIVDLSEFLTFLKRISKRLNDPLFSREALSENRSNNSGKNSFSTQASSEQENDKAKTTAYENHCIFCNSASHEISVCFKLGLKSNSDVKNFIMEKKLCFACGKTSHISKDCKRRKKCSKCKKTHMTILHQDSTPSNDDIDTKGEDTDKKGEDTDKKASSATNYSSTSSLGKSFQPLIPIKVSHKDHPEFEIITYALIDGGSNVCFVAQSICDELRLKTSSSHLKLTTVHGTKVEKTESISGLVCKDFSNERQVKLPTLFVKSLLPVCEESVPTREIVSKYCHLKQISCHIQPPIGDTTVGIIIGTNCCKGTFIESVVSGGPHEPQGIKYYLGWTVQGPMNKHSKVDNYVSNRILAELTDANDCIIQSSFQIPVKGKELLDPRQISNMFELDYCEKECDEPDISHNDRKFLEIVQNTIKKRIDNHYEMRLPLINDNISMPSSKRYAHVRLMSIQRSFKKDKVFCEKYTAAMEEMLDLGYAEKVPCNEFTQCNETTGKIWYIPHFSVTNPNKPDKIRVVFDCAAKVDNISLNEKLLTGPDLTNSLIGVLLRFRLKPIAIMADIKGMFHQVHVPEEDRDLLRFLWWPGGEFHHEPEVYRMTVHLFGARSSPSCANFALKVCADEPCKGLVDHKKAAHCLKKNMYVDDLCHSEDTVIGAYNVVNDTVLLCKNGGFELTKFVTNSKELKDKIPSDLLATSQTVELTNWQEFSIERALGVHWCIENDCLSFRIVLKDTPLTRRGILSTVSSIFDPLGFCAPVTLVGKRILQRICKLCVTRLDWDDPIPENELLEWRKWREDIAQLGSLNIARCYKPNYAFTIQRIELHHFSDASPDLGLGQCSYIRYISTTNEVHCSIVMGKSRVPPSKPITVPRLELQASVLAIRISKLLNRELEEELMKIAEIEETYWTDSQIVLGYINNDAKRFRTFVANRVHEIRKHSSTDQWRYVRTSQNPADHNSRGMTVQQLISSNYLSGPSFLWNDKLEDVSPVENLSIEGDPELRCLAVATEEMNYVIVKLQNISSWSKIKRVLCYMSRFISNSKKGEKRTQVRDIKIVQPLTLLELEEAEITIIKLMQKEYLPELSSYLMNGEQKNSCAILKMNKLDPFIDEKDIIRVGGRLRNANLPYSQQHPVILPKDCPVVHSLIRHFHLKTFHQGRGITINEIRQNGFWIIGSCTVVSKIISDCVSCKKLRGPLSEQKMADLPAERSALEPCFTYVGCDFFGPIMIKERRSQVKRYGCLFTCLSSRAVHIEITASLDTSSFINCMRRFQARRGPVRIIRCDRGTNFVGADNELKRTLQELRMDDIQEEALKYGVEVVEFQFNPPTASHMGGVWERMIRSVKEVLNGVLVVHSNILDNESLLTLMCEVEAILNSRPITTIDSDSTTEALTPNHLLTMKPKVLLPPPGVFLEADVYSKKRWRRIQFLANLFWSRFQKEFLQILQTRQKWTKLRRNFIVGDIVLIKEENVPRNQWKMGKVIAALEGKDKLVRTVKLLVGSSHLDNDGKRTSGSGNTLMRPIHKLVLLLPMK